MLKRVNLDNAGVRSNFLRSGTMARGAAETGKACTCRNQLLPMLGHESLPLPQHLRSGHIDRAALEHRMPLVAVSCGTDRGIKGLLSLPACRS